VSRLGSARRYLVGLGAGSHLDAWVDATVRGGLNENAMTLAGLEASAEHRAAIADAYLDRHPERRDLIARLMRYL
jgi:hypothetical protein